MDDPIEDDLDPLALTSMPEHCVRWPCSAEGRPLVKGHGFMVCPICGSSYGDPT